jgi:hypothetical protein
MYEGALIGEVDPRATTREAVGLMMAGVAAGQGAPAGTAAGQGAPDGTAQPSPGPQAPADRAP